MLDEQNMIDVVSTNIKAISYDGVEKKLYVKFNTGKIYVYFKVPAPVFAGMIVAPSKGKFFASDIKGKFDCELFRCETHTIVPMMQGAYETH